MPLQKQKENDTRRPGSEVNGQIILLNSILPRRWGFLVYNITQEYKDCKKNVL